MTSAAANSTRKNCKRKRATATGNRGVALQPKFAQGKTSHAWLADDAAQFEAGFEDAQTRFRSMKKRLGKVEKEALLVPDKLDVAQRRSGGSAELVEEASHQLAKTLKRRQLLEGEVSFQKLQLSKTSGPRCKAVEICISAG